MKITKLTINRPVTTFMFFLAIVLLGFVSLRELSVDLLPDISYPKISVITEYPGVAPEEIETLITSPLEAVVSTIPGLRKVESISKEGVSFMTLEFDWGTDMDFAILHTREKLDNARYSLPEDAGRPTIILLDPQSKPIMILALSGERSLVELKEFAEELIKPRLEQIEGIASVEIAGGVEREIQVEIKPELLSLYQLSIDEIARKIDSFNRNLQGGTIRKGRFKYAIRVVGEFESIDEIGNIPLKTVPGGVIRLKDIAFIKDSIKERLGLTRLNGKESIGLLVYKESGTNTVKVTKKTREVLKQIREENPQINLEVIMEQAEFIENSINSVLNSIIIGAILAFFVLFLFLQDLRTPVIIAISIPISIIATFNILYFSNISLNIMSLGGLALGVGMLVDSSIVVSESIFRHQKEKGNLIEAAYIGTKEVGMAVTASTLTTISVFLPVIYVHGVAGQLFKDQALTVTFSLLCSLFVSLTLLPMLASREFKFEIKEERVEKKEIRKAKKPLLFPYYGLLWLMRWIFKGIYFVIDFLISYLTQFILLILHYLMVPIRPIIRFVFNTFNKIYSGFSVFYHRFLDWSLNNKGKVLTGSLLFLVITFLAGTQIGRELIPKPKTNTFEINLTTPVDFSLEQTEEIVSIIEKWLKSDSSVETIFSQIGIVTGMQAYDPRVSVNSAKILCRLLSHSDVQRVIKELRTKLSRFPEIDFSIVQQQTTLSEMLAIGGKELSLIIKGDDLDKLNSIANQLVEKLENIEGLADISTSYKQGKPQFLIKLKRNSIEKYGISPGEVGNFIVNSIRGKIATKFKEFERKYDILVRMEKNSIDEIDEILGKNFVFNNSLIPLRDLISYEVVRGPEEIRRENQQRIISITANLLGKKISEVIPEIKNKINEISLPPNYSISFGGEQEEIQKSFRSLIFAFILAAFLVYMIMAAQFESLIHPFLIMFTLPMGLTGSIWALILTRQTINVISIIGMVVLAGIVVNDAIVKIDYTNQLRRKGLSLREAVKEASRVRLRPILMTTVTTAFGLLPMAIGLGPGSELQKPLAISVIGGLLLATFLTLILIPLFYELVEKRKK
ncbi:efflux RND transporter permease subunit [Candidatus Aminicenantes bacterium AC-708-M15]|jgi:HAE1 family hydrophobic/amphiphilic exporter-1|nr:efflux RND transporter permease subunit [SCandidatus Aminicenantes bacterium Aminicenantia_JdfR_composite]MCP2598509.1 efflux RND transporter permease subunit [Candidatus Aminicenantes bacterium AC-335-L06]MCP2604261.1 efflux RND transporter permease subunit [Candidatus Aminicenantes bacterium AC-708-M15]MCP2618864.1 efflux RND transporter permease subunit [Candidatus Aminicenantes bacterium AC-335-A11]MCP2620793.1 efflux RND transporter permease subunit [Candidatus Aminicenantes bacterium A